MTKKLRNFNKSIDKHTTNLTKGGGGVKMGFPSNDPKIGN